MVVGNIVAELLAAAILAFLGLVAPLIWYYFSTYRSLLEFFGLRPERRDLILYLSSLRIPRGGALDAKGVQRSYSGLALSADEATVIGPFVRLLTELQAKPLYALFRWIARKHWSLQVRPLVYSAPLVPTDIEFANLITLGTPGYNEVTGYYHQHGAPTLKWAQNNTQIEICRGPQSGQLIPNPDQQDLAILEKLRDDSKGTTVFIAAGLGVNGTRGAAEYLLRNWRKLRNTCGSRPFAWCLGFPPILQDPDGWQKPTAVWRFPD
jgi:hypothetical protein